MTELQTDIAADAAPAPARFATLALDPKLQRAVADTGYATMTPIQAKAIPIVLAGRDVMGAGADRHRQDRRVLAAAAAASMLPHENASMSPARHPVRALVLRADARAGRPGRRQQSRATPSTRKLRVAVVFGGIDMKPQTLELKARRRGAGRHAGPPARPHRGQELRAEPGRVRRARRGRPHARHRLPARPAAHPVATCPSSARRCCSRPPSRPRSGAWPRATCRIR